MGSGKVDATDENYEVDCPYCDDGYEDHDRICSECRGEEYIEFWRVDEMSYNDLFSTYEYYDEVRDWIWKLYEWQGWTVSPNEILNIINNRFKQAR